MKKHLDLLLAGIFFFSVHANSQITLNDVQYSLDTLETFQAGPGTEYLSVQMKRLSDNGGRLDAFILKVDCTNPYISFGQVLGSGKVIGTERPSAMAERNTTSTKVYFAGTNGDFFVTKGNVGTPIGLAIGDSEFAHIGSTNYRIGAIDDSNRPVLGTKWSYKGRLKYADKDLKINRVNYVRNENELVLYNHHNGATTLTDEYGTELLCELIPGEKWQTSGSTKLKVIGKEQSVGNMAIPQGQVVLSGNGTMAEELNKIEVGTELTVDFSLTIDDQLLNISQCVGGDNYALIVDNGKVETANFWNENHPRTGFGSSMTGDTVIFCVVDGRSRSVGCTTKVLGEIMCHFGAWKATNWDGGGSSCMYVRQFGQVNHGSDGQERAVGNGMFAIANLPEEDNVIADIQAYSKTLKLPKYGMHTPKFLGYNKYGLLLDTDVQGVTLSCDETTGYIDEQGRFVCLNEGTFTATYGDITTTVKVNLVTDAPIQMRLDTVWVSDDTNYPIEVETTIGRNVITLHPAVLTWTVKDPAVCSVTEAGILNGLIDKGETEVYAQLGEFKDTIVVKVEIPESKPLLWNTMKEVPFESKPSSMPFTVTPTDDNKLELFVNFNAGRDPNVKFNFLMPLYSLPQTLELRYDPQGFPLKDMIFNFQAHNSIEKTNYLVESVPTTEPTSIYVDMKEALGLTADDIAIYPIMFNSLKIGLGGDKGEYKMLIEGIYLHYGPIDLGFNPVHTPSFQVYPNPTCDMLHLQGLDNATIVRLYDLQGRCLIQQQVSGDNLTLNISHLQQGSYFINAGDSTVKLIKK